MKELVGTFFEFIGAAQEQRVDIVQVAWQSISNLHMRSWERHKTLAMVKQRIIFKGNTWPAKQKGKYATLSQDEYAMCLEQTLGTLNLNVSGSVLEMYHVTGPCIVVFDTSRKIKCFVDVNFSWDLNTFVQYVHKGTLLNYVIFFNPP